MTLEICVNKIRALRSSYVTEEDLKHRQCETPCPNYRPYLPNMQIPIKQGKVAYELGK